jgi:hypothetical protein
MQLPATPDTNAPAPNAESITPRRLSISKSLRFAVFKRDSFKCQYCGRSAAEVILHCDHMKPVAEGGTTDILNLVTACSDCNLGKGARNLSDHAVVSKQINQLAALQEKREQLEMMLAWRDELNQLDEITIEELDRRWSEHTVKYHLTETGRTSLRKMVKRYGVEAVASAMKTAADQYLEREEDGVPTKESVAKAFDYIGRIATVDRAEQREPGSRQMFYIRGILRRRLEDRYYNHAKALTIIKEAVRSGVPLDTIEEAAKQATSWSSFRNAVEDAAADYADDPSRDTEMWLAQMRAELAKALGDRNAQAALELVIKVLPYRTSDNRLLEIANGWRSWATFRDWLVQTIEWRHYMLATLDDALGEMVPEDTTYEIDNAIRAGVSADLIWKRAAEVRGLPQWRDWLRTETSRLFDSHPRHTTRS